MLCIFYFILDFRSAEEYQSMSCLPTKNTFSVLNESYKVLVARSIVSFLPAFRIFRKYVTKHIQHPFVKEMTEKSETVSY
jgi:hypothetical protein